MFVGSPKAFAVAGLALAVAVAPPASAQSNPFVPASAVSKANVEKIVDERLRAMEDRIIESVTSASAANPPVAGAPMGPPAPGAPINGAAVPGGMMPPGALPGQPGAELAPPEPPKGPVEAARDNGVRFIGCINGAPKFARESGERVTFSEDEVSEAVKSGFLPKCR